MNHGHAIRTIRRSIAARPIPSQSVQARDIATLREAFGPGFQTAVTEQFAQRATQRR